jgi:hypothetical protein
MKRELPSSDSIIIPEDEISHMPQFKNQHSPRAAEMPTSEDLIMTDVKDPELAGPTRKGMVLSRGWLMHAKPNFFFHIARGQKIQNAVPVATCRNSSETVSTASDQGLEILGRGVKELVQAVQKLRHLGIEDLVLPLPKIVVIGDQSTGKSSLIEGMR